MGEAKRKRDLGILPNGMKEELRDQLAKRDWSKAPDRNKLNPNHMDTAELKEARWSGLKFNHLVQQVEIWLLGDMRYALSKSEIENNPARMEEIYEEIFKLKEVELAPPPEERS